MIKKTIKTVGRLWHGLFCAVGRTNGMVPGKYIYVGILNDFLLDSISQIWQNIYEYIFLEYVVSVYNAGK